MTALLLGAYGLTLSLVAPRVLTVARWPDRAPAAAVLLWQAITLASVLSALGVVLAAPEELTRAAGAGRPVVVAALVGALTVASTIVVRLLICLYGVMRRSGQRRERHRMLVDLLERAEERGGLRADHVRVLQAALPLAYCVPGRDPRVVLSAGALHLLEPVQLDAVLAHEQAHLRHRHELVMESLTAFYRAVPRPLRSRAPLDAVHLLLEMSADDVARRRAGRTPLRTALERLTDAVPLTEDVAPTDEGRRRRLERLATPDGRDGVVGVITGLAATAFLVLPTVTVVLPWLRVALPAWPFR